MWLFWLLLIAWFIAIPFVVPRATKAIADGTYKRFSLRWLMLAITVCALLLWTIPAALEARQWWITSQYMNLIFEEVSRAETLTHRSGQHQQQYWTIANYPYQEQRQTNVSGHEGQTVAVAAGNPITAETQKHRKQRHIYIHPPGQWAETPEEAIQLLKDHL